MPSIPIGPLLRLLCIALLASAPAAARAPSPSGERASLLFYDDFEDTSLSRQTWGPNDAYAFTQGKSGWGLRVNQPDAGLSRVVSATVSLEGAGGCLVALSAHLRTEKVQADSDPATGAVLYVRIHDSGSLPVVYSARSGEGTRGWWNAGVLVPVPAGAESATLYAGLEGSSGVVFIDNVRLEVVRAPEDYPPARDPSLPIDKGHALGTLRGAMIDPGLTPADLEELGGAWNANLIRWQLGSTLFTEGLNTPGFDGVLESELARLDAALPHCRRLGVLVLVDLHSLSAGCFDNTAAQDRFVAAWEAIASRYRDERMVWGYDLANEPDGFYGAWGEGVALWDDLAERTARAIRAVDPRRPIVVEPVHGSPAGFPYLVPLDPAIPGVLYSVHMYEPGRFTHQTLPGFPDLTLYPGHIGGEYWNKDRLREALRPARDFQEKYRVAVLVGEFSAIRWALNGSAFRYLRDTIEVFEEWDWDWCYHAFREWHGWSVEHTENAKDPNPAPEPTDRELLLRGWFAGNAKYFPGHDRPIEKP